SGCGLENGLALACLEESDINVLVAEDREQGIGRHSWLSPYYRRLGIVFDILVLNRAGRRAEAAAAGIKERFGYDNSNIITVKYSENEVLSDHEGLSLLQYRDPGFAKDIRKLSMALKAAEGAEYGSI
ncbi:MAG: hypothetical protein IJM17_09700, partial [Firmicutes bacterium]|nr:hypothetical protein [Bacillota bacterium]